MLLDNNASQLERDSKRKILLLYMCLVFLLCIHLRDLFLFAGLEGE